MEWLGYVLTSLGGGLTTGIPLFFWGWRQANALRAERQKIDTDAKERQSAINAKAERDEYELDKIRSSDAYQELIKVMAEIKASAADDRREAAEERSACRREVESLRAEIKELQKREMDWVRKSAMQEAEIYKQLNMIEYLEKRLKALESVNSPQQPPSPQNATITTAIKEIAKEAIAEAPKSA